MAKPPKKPKPEEVETDPGAWERFEHAVDAAVKSGPKHRTPPKPKHVKRGESRNRDGPKRGGLKGNRTGDGG